MNTQSPAHKNSDCDYQTMLEEFQFSEPRTMPACCDLTDLFSGTQPAPDHARRAEAGRVAQASPRKRVALETSLVERPGWKFPESPTYPAGWGTL